MMNYLEWVGAVTGLLYLGLEYRASIWLWPVSILMPAIYLVVYYQAGLYADAGLSVYYVLAGIYGWWMWLRSKSRREERPIRPLPKACWAPLAGVSALLFLLLYSLLAMATDSTVPGWDSLTTALSIVAMWMLAHKYVEQWLVWLVVDVLSCGLYLYKDLDATAALYGLYALLAWLGYREWQRLMVVSSNRISLPKQPS